MACQSKCLSITAEEIAEIGRANIRAFLSKYLIHFGTVCASPVAVYHVMTALSREEENEDGQQHLGTRIFGTGLKLHNTFLVFLQMLTF